MRKLKAVLTLAVLAFVCMSGAALAANGIAVNAPGLNSTGNKLQVTVDGTVASTNAFVKTDHPNGETHYRMRFWIDPSSLPIVEGNAGTNHIRYFRVNDQNLGPDTALGTFIVGFITKSIDDHSYHWITWVKENDLVFRSRGNIFLGTGGGDIPAQLEVEFTQGNNVANNICMRKLNGTVQTICRGVGNNLQLSNGDVDFVDIGMFTNSNPSNISGNWKFDEFESYR